MRRHEHKATCERVRECCGRLSSLTPREMLDDLDIMVDARNICAHEERLWCAKVGPDDGTAFPEVIATVKNYLTTADDAVLDEMLAGLARSYRGRNAVIDTVIDGLGI